MQDKRARIYTVGQVNFLIKEVLENNLPSRLTVIGQISDWRGHQSGHCYFLLKDKTSQLPCVMWKSKFAKVKFKPETGQEVLLRGFIDAYPPQGKYQFYIESMTPAGVGDLQLEFERMVKRLETEGLFREEYKKPLPKYPDRIGILTSESGAAVHDIADSIFNRWPCAKLFLYPVPVQGKGAAEKIAISLRDINRRNKQLKIDVVIVGRGGGSLEDLWAFNEEVLARAIFDSAIPVISAVGHEINVTIADLVADARASTPTKAGITAVPDMQQVLEQLDFYKRSLDSKTKARVQLCVKSLETFLASAVFRNPLLPVQNAEQRLDEFENKLSDSIRRTLRTAEVQLQRSYQNVIKIEPRRLIGKKTVDLTDLDSRANNAIKAVVNKCQLRLVSQQNRLEALNPKLVLKRGYSITTNTRTAALVKTSEDVQIDDLLTTELADNKRIESKVTDIYP